jgi:hypothetical protein
MTDENTFHGEHRRELERAIKQARAEIDKARSDVLVGMLVWYSAGFFFGGLTVAIAVCVWPGS